MKRSPPVPWYMMTSAALLCIPAALILAASLAMISALFIPSQRDGVGGPSLLGGILFPIPAALLLFAEYRAVARRDARWAARIASVFLFATLVGSPSVLFGLLSLLGLLPRDRGFSSWSELAVYTMFLVVPAGIGYAHLRWSRVLKPYGGEDFFDLPSR